MENLDSEKKKLVYELILSRYSDMIKEKENRSISEIRQMITPYDPDLKELRDKLLEDLQPYVFEKHFFSAVQKCIEYIKSIQNIKLPVVFWMTFKELDDIKAGPITDQSILLCSLLRSLGSEDAKIYVTDSKKYVAFDYIGELYLIDPASGSLLQGLDVENAVNKDNLKYSFSDIHFESFEE